MFWSFDRSVKINVVPSVVRKKKGRILSLLIVFLVSCPSPQAIAKVGSCALLFLAYRITDAPPFARGLTQAFWWQHIHSSFSDYWSALVLFYVFLPKRACISQWPISVHTHVPLPFGQITLGMTPLELDTLNSKYIHIFLVNNSK